MKTTDTSDQPAGNAPPATPSSTATEMRSPPLALRAAVGYDQLLESDSRRGLVRIAFTARPEFCHTFGTTVQGGFITAWLDMAMAHAVIALVGADHGVASLEIKVSFLERVGPGPVVAAAKVIRRGRRVVFLDAELSSPDGKILATATSTTMLVPLPNPPA